MLAVYVAAALVGAVLILVTLLGGGHEHGFDHGLDHSGEISLGHEGLAGGDHDAHGGDAQSGWLPFLSLRFWTYFALTFGLVGAILELIGQVSASTPIIAAASGLVSGYLVMRILRLIRAAAGNSTQGVQDILGTTGRVLVALNDQEPGKIRCSVKGDSIDLIALSHDRKSIPAGEEVVVLAMDGTRATVQRRSELFGEDVSDSESS